jgi:hypothetical protein
MELDWYGLSRNPNITWDIVKNNQDKPWYIRMLADSRYQTYNLCPIFSIIPSIGLIRRVCDILV